MSLHMQNAFLQTLVVVGITILKLNKEVQHFPIILQNCKIGHARGHNFLADPLCDNNICR